MIALSFVVLAVASIFWMLIGYSLAFGPDIGGVIGNLDYAFLNGVGTDAGEKGYPPLGFMVFQLFFAAVTITIVTSGVAERVKLSSFIVFMLLWTHICLLPDCPLGMGRGMGTVRWDFWILPGVLWLRSVRGLPHLPLPL